MPTEEQSRPEEICFNAGFKRIADIDYPSNDASWPLMSPRMLDVLTTVGDFPHRRIPVRFIDHQAVRKERYLLDGRLRPEIVDDRFIAVQLTQHIDIVDWENSVFRRSRFDTSKVRTFFRLALSVPASGLPPLFRLAAKPGALHVSSTARQALEEAGIRGMAFLNLPNSERRSQR